MTREPSDPRASAVEFLQGGGEMGARIRERDWAHTPLGPPESWPRSLKTAVRIILTSRQPMFVWWGDDLINLYNDPYKAIVGGKHPDAFGQPASVVWREIWDQVGPRAASVRRDNEGTYDESLLLIMERYGYREETYYTFSYSPIPGDDGGTGGIICANTDDTQRIVGERQLALLRELAARSADARTVAEACALSARCFEANRHDVPFAMLYLYEPENRQVVLSAVSGIARGHEAVPERVSLDQESPWPLARVVETHEMVVVEGVDSTFADLPTGVWPVSPHSAVVAPVAAAGETGRSGLLVAGLNPFRVVDDNYRGFVGLLAAQVAASIANAQAYEEERRRAEALAELDRAKTAFFSNVSHEFRTPLTLMLGPLEDVIASADRIPDEDRRQLEVVHRNGQRLLKLVNTLLDFSRIEAGRVAAVYAPTDLSEFTTDLASLFRSTMERAGLRFAVECEPLGEVVYVDRDMWEKIVFNLVSNAFKFTFEGGVTVRLRRTPTHAELGVTDTGVGIPNEELPRLFERFHRVEGVTGRTHEGTGIGLALVQELVRLHGGDVRVESTHGVGTSFTISIPFGTEHLAADRVDGAAELASTRLPSSAFVDEALRWLPGEVGDADAPLVKAVGRPTSGRRLGTAETARTARILVADDNADMRDYVRRLLSSDYEVDVAADGEAALASIAERRPDLILSDVMMPKVDGFGLIERLRSDEQTRTIPLILLSARAGEESRVEGLAAGADDYLAKPFGAKELLARTAAHLEMARMREEAGIRERTLREEADAAREQIVSILESISDGFVALDREWRYVYVNSAAERMSQIARSDTLGRVHWDLFPETLGTEVETELRRVMTDRTNGRFVHYNEPRHRWFESAVYATGDGGISLYVRDVTELRRAEAERASALEREQAARRQAEEASRAKDEFLATVSHELRTPLNSILGWARMLRTGRLDEPTIERALETIERNTVSQSQLIEDLLDISRIITGKMRIAVQRVDLAAVVHAAVDSNRPAAEAKNIRLEVVLDTFSGTLLGDPERLQQVAWNLVSNAVKFTLKGGRVQVHVERVNSHVELTVADTGRGISPEFLPHVFDRFRQADGGIEREIGGLGLGLSIVRHIVELHGGTVGVESDGPGHGAVFTVRLPLSLARRPEGDDDRVHSSARTAMPFANAAVLDGLRLLVVDDEADTRELLGYVLGERGAAVQTAASAQEAMEVLERWQPDLLLSDIGMPGEDGYKLIRAIRNHDMDGIRRVPAIALTAYARAEDRVRIFSEGFEAHLPKPVEPIELVAVIAGLTRKR